MREYGDWERCEGSNRSDDENDELSMTPYIVILPRSHAMYVMQLAAVLFLWFLIGFLFLFFC